jgi:hypothetical protein
MYITIILTLNLKAPKKMMLGDIYWYNAARLELGIFFFYQSWSNSTFDQYSIFKKILW